MLVEMLVVAGQFWAGTNVALEGFHPNSTRKAFICLNHLKTVEKLSRWWYLSLVVVVRICCVTYWGHERAAGVNYVWLYRMNCCGWYAQ